MSRLRIALATSIVMLVASACAKPIDHCRQARTSATNAWSAYLAALERSHAEVLAGQRETHERLSGELQRRFESVAQQSADQQHARGSDAWSRAYRAAYDEACAKDDECRAWRDANATADATLVQLTTRIPLARAALAAVDAAPGRAKAAAEALGTDPAYPQLEQAQELTGVVFTSCKNLGTKPPRAGSSQE